MIPAPNLEAYLGPTRLDIRLPLLDHAQVAVHKGHNLAGSRDILSPLSGSLVGKYGPALVTFFSH
jgi:hypothetical protein